VYVGTFTKAFIQEVERLRTSSNVWWAKKGSSGAEAPRAPFENGRYPAGGELADGLEVFEFDDVTGELTYQGGFSEDIANPQYLALHPTLPILYASEMSRPGRISAFRLDESLSGKFPGRAFTADTGADLAIAISVHPSGAVAYVPHYSDGTLTALQLERDGTVADIRQVVAGQLDIGATRLSRHHESHFTSSGNGLLVTDIGLEELTIYRTDADGTFCAGSPTHVPFPAGSAPRHMVCHPAGRFVYIVGEADSMLYVLEASDGIPTRIVASHLTKPPHYTGDNKTSDIVLHPNGRFLYVGNRGSDGLTVCSLDGDGGVEIVGFHSSLGKGPSSLGIDPTGRFLLVGNTYSGDLVVFRIDDNGALHPQHSPITARAPRCLVFGPPVAQPGA
jgi:6-phosphogluconolactonase